MDGSEKRGCDSENVSVSNWWGKCVKGRKIGAGEREGERM